MKPVKNFDKVRGYSNGASQLPVGGYVLKINGVRHEDGENGNSSRTIVAFDVIEGEYTGFFKKKYDTDQNEDKKWKGTMTVYEPKDDGSEQDVWTQNKLKTLTNALEDSNSGYKWDWDEKKWKGLIFGGLFGEVHTIIDGRQIQYTACKSYCSVDDIRKKNYKIPKAQYKNGASTNNSNPADSPDMLNEGFMQIPEGADEEIPF